MQRVANASGKRGYPIEENYSKVVRKHRPARYGLDALPKSGKPGFWFQSGPIVIRKNKSR